MTSSDSEEQARPRKRSRAGISKNETVEGKKMRGRPRVDAQDATAADRRRTQIRLAQRAYRQRKETTIASLQQQTTQLHAIIQHMNKTFVHLNESAQNSGLLQSSSALTQEFKHVSETFANLGKTASESYHEGGEEDQSEPAAEQSHHVQGSRVEEYSYVPTKEDHVDMGWGYSAVTTQPLQKYTPPQSHIQQPDHHFQPSNSYNGVSNTAEQSTLVRRRQFTACEGLDQPVSIHTTPYQQPVPSASSQQQQSPFGLVDRLSPTSARYTPPIPYEHPVIFPTPMIPHLQLETPTLQMSPNSLTTKTLSPIQSHAYDETSFARQLLRATLESAFRLLTYEGSIRPMAMNHVFKLSLYFFNLDNLRTRFRDLLSRSINEELDWWEAPFLHLGGAGTHYPRRDAGGNIISMRNSWTIRQIGPMEKRMVRVESVADGQWEDIDGVDLSGFEGEWFDAYDVQGYLEERWGCRIDPKSSFAECWVEEEEDDAPTSSPHSGLSYGDGRRESDSPSLSQGSTSTRSSNQQQDPEFRVPDAPFGLDMPFATGPMSSFPNESLKPVNLDLSYDQTLGLDLAPSYDFGGHNLDANMSRMNDSEQFPVIRQKKKKMAWIEVPMFISKMISQCVCLGRAPGFRRKAIDVAMRESFAVAY
ncbi:hypothetical protein P153DRAFT_319132 [Dothidotthia symphoricarpi CBS 119687]|uniref:BZIP domain-containing protein n=1 Tax=Dothidotthia symphoricarpi CBS 119687 TaxID=1392245 RepID=A0A6A6A7L8_9PLEO|nr:uncharacterized protein P153DRAFT_319132 [Dothidotthia symphoricarpi CBS 119687]KAF2127972.1 hypothetical protein P153DRAFT_319132 [Dothidotthia symphoricarpi CBS 119687]